MEVSLLPSNLSTLGVGPANTAAEPGASPETQYHQTLMRVPVELLRAILSLASPSALAFSIQSSSILYDIGRPILYRHISNDRFTLNRSRDLLFTLSSNHELASLVQTINFRLSLRFGKPKDWALLNSALRRAVNLEGLELPLPLYGPDLFAGVAYPKLKSLKFMAFRETPNIPFHDCFLSQHPSIRVLHIAGDNSSLFKTLPDHALPHLNTLSVMHPQNLTNLTPNRPLNKVTVILRHHDLAPMLATALSGLHRASGVGVQALRLDLRSGLGVSLDAVLWSLAGLPIATLNLEFARDGSPTLDQLEELVTTLSHLRSFVITHVPNPRLDRRMDQRILDWFILRPTLELVATVKERISYRRFARRVSISIEGEDPEDERLTFVNITRWNMDEGRSLADRPEECSDWRLLGYIWEHIGGDRQDNGSVVYSDQQIQLARARNAAASSSGLSPIESRPVA